MENFRRFWGWATRSRKRAVVVLGALVLVMCCCPMAAVGSLLGSSTPTPEGKGIIADTLLTRSSPTVRPSTTFEPTATSQPTATPQPTATFAPSATFEPTATSRPTATPQPTATVAPTAIPAPAATVVPSPAGAVMRIARVNKGDEYVDLVNEGDQGQDLAGWVLVSERGNQRCGLGGVIEAGGSLRVYAGIGTSGDGAFYCGFDGPIWNNSEPDAAVLLDGAGMEVDRR